MIKFAKKVFSVLGLLILLLGVGGCSAGLSAKQNAEAFLHAFYDCPDEALIMEVAESKSFQGAEEKFGPYLAEDYREEFIKKYGTALHGVCSESGGTSKITDMVSVMKEDRVEATVTVACTDKDGGSSTVTMEISLSTDQDGKISFFRLPSNNRDYYTAVGDFPAE